LPKFSYHHQVSYMFLLWVLPSLGIFSWLQGYELHICAQSTKFMKQQFLFKANSYLYPFNFSWHEVLSLMLLWRLAICNNALFPFSDGEYILTRRNGFFKWRQCRKQRMFMGGFHSRDMVVICIGYALFVMSQFDVLFLFPNQRFVEVCWHSMHIVIHQGFPTWGKCTPRGTFAYLKGYI